MNHEMLTVTPWTVYRACCSCGRIFDDIREAEAVRKLREHQANMRILEIAHA